ncbi:MAG: hypothetical protein H0X33_02710 [Taibaiella sp.]|nr:hypothetical protein [Taibaiella sp.]
MKNYILFLLPVILLLASCKNTWTQDDKDMFYQACIDDANSWAGSPVKAKAYCDCMQDKMIKKYPSVNDALEKIDTVINDPELRSCKEEVMGKKTNP